ncbi:elongation factor G [Pectinatus frisingensis]|uniref:elongation factor G n=1 Tax=Pectinatus frisingensis TaxID=865 RepID=UPI0018C5DF43|nr:elongation factor G [Pectinatus frisingensis]
MTEFSSVQLRNISVVGHSKCGKTSIVENCLYKSGSINRIGKTADGSSVLDYEPEEIKHKMTINTTLAACEWHGYKINFLDTPGYPDFTAQVQSAMSVSEAALIIVSASSGVEVETDKAWQYAEKISLPRAIFINKLDRDNVDFNNIIDELRIHFGKGVVPIQLPIGQANSFHGVADLITMNTKVLIKNQTQIYKIPDYMQSTVTDARHILIESLAEFNDKLLEKYLNGEEISETETAAALIEGIVTGKIFPVLCGSAEKGIGFRQLLNSIIEYLPTPYFRTSVGSNLFTNSLEERNTEDAFSAVIFKTVVDQFIGRTSYIKILSGSMRENSTLYNSSSQKTERIGTICTACGKNILPIKRVSAGDIITVTKLQSSKTGDTLCYEETPICYEKPDYPEPMLKLAITAKDKTDEDKINPALSRLIDEEPSLKLEKDNRTGELCISGIGELHLDIALEKLQRKFGVSAYLTEPAVAYRETIKTAAKAEGKYKKQSGGHGQYGDVWLEISPLERGCGIQFTETIFGGAVPRQYIPAVEKGIRETLAKGLFSNYPMTDIKTNLTDGSYHTVDSSEMAFKTAAGLALKKAVSEASPTILEPYCSIKITVPEYYIGTVIGGLNTKRGRILNTSNPAHDISIIEAQVPEAELIKYATELRSQTQGKGSYSIDFSHYEEVPDKIRDKLLEK